MPAPKRRIFLRDVLQDEAQIERVVRDAIDGKYSLYYLSTSSNSTETLLSKGKLAKIQSRHPQPARLGSDYNPDDVGYADLRVREDSVDKLLADLLEPVPERLIKPKNQQPYCTAWLAVMDAAIAAFFHPVRRNPDAKKEEVTQWIIKEAIKNGIANASENIAQSLFTIIKPANHNPKVRRK